MAFRHILFPVDFSDRSKALCPLVKAWADQFHAKLTLLHVTGVPIDAMSGMERFPVVFDFQALEPVIKQRLASFMHAQAANIAVEMGDAATTIAAFARDHGVDLIMMPTHGYGKFRSLLMGSVVSKVLHDADCAVWTAPHAELPEMRKHWPCKQVLVAVDRGVEQAPVLRSAVELAKELGANVRLVHAVPGAERQPNETGGDEFGMFLLDAARKEMAKLQAEAGTNLEASVIAGGVGKVVHQLALDCEADLLVIGRGVMHETFGRLRTQSYQIIRQSPCPVLSL